MSKELLLVVDAVAAERPRRWMISASGLKRTPRPLARIDAQKSASSVYMK